MPLYFAYGSNMDREAMAKRCPASRPLGMARLARSRFVIMREGYASVARDPRRSVWGLAWDLALADLPALDRYEGVAAGLYVKTQAAVLTQAGPRRVLLYVGRNAGPGRPRPGYLESVIEAARQIGLPERYREELEAGLGPSHRGQDTDRPPPAGEPVAAWRPAVTPTRASPLTPMPAAASAGWSWQS